MSENTTSDAYKPLVCFFRQKLLQARTKIQLQMVQLEKDKRRNPRNTKR